MELDKQQKVERLVRIFEHVLNQQSRFVKPFRFSHYAKFQLKFSPLCDESPEQIYCVAELFAPMVWEFAGKAKIERSATIFPVQWGITLLSLNKANAQIDKFRYYDHQFLAYSPLDEYCALIVYS
jgi:hypothetical protein